MKIKLLINSRKTPLLKEFVTHADTAFECLSTSDLPDDIEGHFKYFEPNGYVFCPEYYSPDGATHLVYMKKTAPFSGTPIFLMGEPEVCNAFEERMPENVISLYFRRPITISGIIKQITAFYEEQERQRKQAELLAEAEKQRLAELMKDEKKHILIVDDDRSILKLLKTALETDYEVTTMIGGKMARKYLENKTTDLILLDYEMPLENGPEVFKKIRAEERFANTPIVFLTGVADLSKIKEVLALQPQGYLLKPIDMERLTSTIKELIG